MSDTYSVKELAEAVNSWCAEHQVSPVSGQVGELLTERNIRYYRSLGLIAAPKAGRGKGFGSLQRRQLIAIRILQSAGQPLRKIQELLFGKSEHELAELESRWLEEQDHQAPRSTGSRTDPETWLTMPVDDEFLLISRHGRQIDSDTMRAIREILNRGSK